MPAEAASDPLSLLPALRFLAGGGTATQLILDRDWSGHPLGPPAEWPDILKVTLATILNSPESMILAWGRDTLSFFFNETYQPLLGPRAAWAMGAPFVEVWADGWEQAKPIIDDAFAGRAQRFTDLPWKLDTDRGAADTWWSFSYSRVLDPAGEIAGLFIFTNETTARVLGDAALRQSEERLRLVIEGAKDHAIFTCDPGGTITGWSAGAAAVLGWSAEEAIGRSASMIFTAEDRAAGADVGELVTAARDGCANDERWHLRNDGRRVFLNGSVHPLPVDAHGLPRGFIKIARDETQRWHAQQQLTALNATLERQVAERTAALRLFANVVQSDQAPIVAFDHGLRVIGFNRAHDEALFAAAGRCQHVGAPLVETYPDGRPAALCGLARRALAGERFLVPDEEPAAPGPDTRRWELAFSPLMDEHGAIFGAFYQARDITDRLGEQAQLAETQEALRQSQKMEAVGQLTGGVAHDFNNLLTVIRGSVDLLRRDDLTPEKRARYVAAIGETADRAAKLTGQLLAFARRQALRPETFDVRERIASIAEMIDTVTGARVSLHTDFPDRAAIVRADISQFETAIVNMSVNARDAMAGEGTLAISVRCGTPMPPIRGHAGSAGAFVAVSLADTGGGIVALDVPRIFEPFFTTKEVGKGTGLGLSQVFGFAKQSGGDVDVVVAPGLTTFTLYLPEVAAALPAGIAGDEEAPALDGTGLCVLVVEDNVEVGRFSTQALEDLGYATRWAASAEDALALLGDDGNDFDAVFSDVVMPGIGGLELARRLAATMPAMPVVLASGYSHVLAEEGTHGHELLHKPYSAEQLSRILGNSIRRMRGASR